MTCAPRDFRVITVPKRRWYGCESAPGISANLPARRLQRAVYRVLLLYTIAELAKVSTQSVRCLTPAVSATVLAHVLAQFVMILSF